MGQGCPPYIFQDFPIWLFRKPTQKKYMTIDERLERLAERHEALAQSVEMLRDTVHETSATVASTARTVDELATTVDGLAASVAALVGLTGKTLDAVGILAESVKSHERRLEVIEDNA